MGVPQVVIVGRPNVGKSSLFNWLAGRRVAIVDPTPGVTRDRLSYLLAIGDRFVELVDTGGMGVADSDVLGEEIERQIEQALDTASLILHVVDTQAGLLPLDQEVAKRLRYVDIPVVCVANKTDNAALEVQAQEFYKLGRKVIMTSVTQNRGKEELLEEIRQRLPPPPPEGENLPPPEMKLAIVGRRNVGKSTFINTLVHAERMITSEIPGTTRDSVDVRFELEGKAFIAIDTPGVLRRRSIASDLDFYSLHRAQRSIRRADVVLLFLDPTQHITKLDKQLAEYIAQQYKPCIFVVNKWDLMVGKASAEKWALYIRDSFPTMTYAPIAFISGKTGKNVKALLNHAQILFHQARQRIPTAQLNQLLRAALTHYAPPSHQGRKPRLYYGTQVAVQPPTLVIFCNQPQWLSAPYQRYLLGFLRDKLPYSEVPIKLYLRRRSQSDTRDEIGIE
ncbi:MAG: ribosome biogenesis GTPase Der [Thermoguttaceae bacterium]|nr:ribosome biogenesis GTPase Der [Thermoguttaceae bacterium]MDW8037768.1 ribosome biogenesis GTPase Der [Thermoguttaceae bacterium]